MALTGKHLGGNINATAGHAQWTLITNATVISNITNPANWNGDGTYTGSTTGLSAWDFYYDNNYNQRYEYDGTTLRRITFNTLV